MLRWLTGRKANPFRLFNPSEPSRGVPKPADGGLFPDGTGWVLVWPDDVRCWFADFPDGWMSCEDFFHVLQKDRIGSHCWQLATWMDEAQARQPECTLFIRPADTKPYTPPRPKLYREN